MFNREARRRQQAGFILMEVLVAGVILGIALIGLNVALARCIHGLSISHHYQVALEIMNEQFKTLDLEVKTQRRSVQEGSMERDGLHFAWKRELMPTNDPHLYKKIVSIKWNPPGGPQEETWESYWWEETPQ